MAAGMILVREAGGFVSAIRDGDDPMEKGSIVAGNANLFEDFRKVIRGD
jgi:myo-inositol-1(or 4)-monophosphatase